MHRLFLELEQTNHRGLPKIQKIILDEKQTEITLEMEYISKGTLEQWHKKALDKNWKISNNLVLYILSEVIEALDYLHKKHNIHH